MKSFDTSAVLENRFAKIGRHYNNLLEDFEIEEIHQFRLNVKKLKAFLVLLNADAATKKSLTLTKPLKTFYHAVGELRNRQLGRQEISRLCEPLGLETPYRYLHRSQNEETKAKTTARSLALRTPLHKLLQNLRNNAPDKVSEDAIENFVAGQKYALMKLLLVSNYSDENLHSMRKLLKRFLYLWPWAAAEITSVPHCACFEKGVCVSLCETLGDFHDRCIALQLLNDKRMFDGLSVEEKETLTALVTEAQKEKDEQKAGLVSRLQRCVQDLWEEPVLNPIYEYQ